jgi:hypothetical protein
MKTIDIKGKEYVTVNERIKHFIENKKDWYFLTEVLEKTEKTILMKATVYNPLHQPVANGHAYEVADSTFINKTSHIENCETSAIGRALGMIGIGIDTSIASADEVANAIINQGKTKKELKEDENWIPEMEFEKCKTLIMEGLIDDAREIVSNYKINNKQKLELKELAEFNKNLK